MNKLVMGILVSLLVAAAAGSFYVAYVEFQKDQILWDDENACIASYISDGVERRDIVRSNGSCYVK